MNSRARTILIVVGAGVTLVAGIVTVVYFFQPWRSCSYEDTSIGCAMLPADAVVMAVSMLSGLVGLAVMGTAALMRPRESER